MSWAIYLKFLSAGKFMLIEYLTLIYIFAYFCNAIWLFYQLIIHACSEANFWEKYFFCKFFSSFRFSMWSVQMDLLLHPDEPSLAICWSSSWSDTSGQDLYRFKTDVFFFFAIHTSMHFLIYHGMLCVFLMNFSRDFGICCTSLIIPWSSLCLPLFFLSLCAFRILERRLQLTVRTLGQAVRTPSGILVITFNSNIGLGRNWRRWKT
jgi:hypothetical protein